MNEILILCGMHYDELLAKRLGLMLFEKYQGDPFVLVRGLKSFVPSCIMPDFPSLPFRADLFDKFKMPNLLDLGVSYEDWGNYIRSIRDEFSPSLYIELHDYGECWDCRMNCANLHNGKLEHSLWISEFKNNFLRSYKQELSKFGEVQDGGPDNLCCFYFGNRKSDPGPGEPLGEELIVELGCAKNYNSEQTLLKNAFSIMNFIIELAKKERRK